MKQNKKIKWKRGEIYLTVCLDLSFLRCVKGETNDLCEKEIIVVILFIEITFQIDWLSDYSNWGWLGSIRFMSKTEN